MKLKITLLTFMCFAGYLAQAQTTLTGEITGLTVREPFNGTYGGGGNYYCCGGEPLTYATVTGTADRAYLSLADAYNSTNTVLGTTLYATASGNGTTTGSMVDALDIISNTPVLSSYDGAGFAQSTYFDSRSYLLYAFFGGQSSNTVNISANQTFSLKVTNHQSTDALLRISFTSGFTNVYCCVSEISGAQYVFTIPGNTTTYIAKSLSIGSATSVKLQTGNFVGRITFDDLRLGFAFPTTFDIAAADDASNISAGNTLKFTPTSNSQEYNSEVLWSVVNSNAGATTIDSTGLLTAIPTAANGFVTVTGVSAYNQALKKSIVLNVGPPKPVTAIAVSGPDTLYVSSSFSAPYTATITPSDAASKSISWSLAPTSNNIVNILGAVKALVPGIYTIIGTNAATGITGSKVIFIGVSVTGLTITGPAVVTIGGVSGTFTGAVSPSSATNRTVIWSTSPASIATINSVGVLNPLLPGTVTVTGTLGSFTKTLVVSVISVPGLGSTGISTSELSTSITVYPNPVSDVLSISFSGVVSSVIVFNTVGTQVAAGTGNNISLASLPEGFYTVEIVTNLGTVFKSIIKTK